MRKNSIEPDRDRHYLHWKCNNPPSSVFPPDPLHAASKASDCHPERVQRVSATTARVAQSFKVAAQRECLL